MSATSWATTLRTDVLAHDPTMEDNVNPVHSRTDLGRMALGARIRETRERASLSIADLATRAGISYSYLSDVERGRRLPTLQVLDSLAVSLDGSVLALLRGIYPWDTTATAPTSIAPLPDGRRRA